MPILRDSGLRGTLLIPRVDIPIHSMGGNSNFSLSLQVAHSWRQILSPWGGDRVDSGLGLSYRPTSLCSLAGRYNNPICLNFIPPVMDYEFCYCLAREPAAEGRTFKNSTAFSQFCIHISIFTLCIHIHLHFSGSFWWFNIHHGELHSADRAIQQ